MYEFTLYNGLKTMYYPINHSYSVSIGLYVKIGSMYESIENNGITHFLEHLHFRQLGEINQKQIYYEMESIGATLKATTYKDMLRFYIKVRPKYLQNAVMFFKDLISTYNWNEEQFELEKAVVLNQIFEREAAITIPPFIDKVVWRNHPLSMEIMGNEETINQIKLKEITGFKQKHFSRNNLLFLVTGNIDRDSIKWINEILEDVIIQEDRQIEIEKPRLHDRKPDIFFAEFQWDYLDIDIAFDVNNSVIKSEILLVLNSILGGGNGSLLQTHIREELGLSSNIYSFIETFGQASVLHIFYSIDKNFFYDSLLPIMQILNCLKREIENTQMETTIPFFTDDLWFWLEDPEYLNFQLARDIFIKGEKMYTIEEKIEKFSNISKNSIVKAAQEIFVKNNMSIAILGNTRKITKKGIRELISI